MISESLQVLGSRNFDNKINNKSVLLINTILVKVLLIQFEENHIIIYWQEKIIYDNNKQKSL